MLQSPTITPIEKKPLGAAEKERYTLAAFPFHGFPTELALEIIRYATTPDFTLVSTSTSAKAKRENPYRIALNCCLVSHAIRAATIPYLLHTVALSNDCLVRAFIRAIHIQRAYRHNSTDPQNTSESPLAVDYTKHVKRMWCGPCWEDEPIDGGRIINKGIGSSILTSASSNYLDYGALWEVMRGAESLGIHSEAFHLLHNGLATEDTMNVDENERSAEQGVATEPVWSPQWNCRRITFVGDRQWRWNPLTSTREGKTFLSGITHLVMWMPDQDQENTSNETVTPSWLANVPFNMMRSLAVVGVLLSRPRSENSNPNSAMMPESVGMGIVPAEMLVYHLPATPASSAKNDSIYAATDSTSSDRPRDPELFRRWAGLEDVTNMDTNNHSSVVHLHLHRRAIANSDTTTTDWENAWLVGQSDIDEGN